MTVLTLALPWTLQDRLAQILTNRCAPAPAS